MNFRAACLTAPIALFLGCASGPPPLPPPKAPPTPPRMVQTPPKGLEAPVDRWRRELARRLPAPWRLERIDAQVTAPTGWTRTAGDRGVAIWLTDGQQRQAFHVMPSDFDGYISDVSVAARPMVQSDRLRLFGPRSVARGWKADEELEVALGLVPPSPEQALALDRRAARADLDRIAEAVARFRSDVGFHPLRLSQLWEPPAKVRGWKGPYLEGPLYDPWGSGYAYRPGRRSFFLCSYGADGAPGGQGADADVVREESLQK